ncbi:3'(2'),5'-bisphosphate nucleotidase CysQ [Prochlorococcus marinus]|uniref:3'(2'),5'-bisphosphate nucleotidase CysQ n=1 Tax=Prochlorococcus marinus TaxID=1219 RepID=UPI001ADC20CA|nr:3'(2'),5'-bisphosphate nucleotidase CysQ [Prochlorococcus marinus]MBO8221383.1 3'(2'),5'-bisphosphate nucleotidase CysQ [Prochlorococcus marinus CUG1417]MBW3074192.1 3'(2'),5'-bisphosphate nucleotidase CysQ [Prochlorococcus marinus str. MU1417]
MVKLPVGVDINNLIDDLRIFSWEAADILINYSQKLKSLDQKNKIIQNTDIKDPVTIADLEVNDLILKRMKEKYNNITWKYLSEENTKINLINNLEMDSEWLWILDPLDGTKDFIQGTGDYAMQFALNHEKKPVIGVVLIPEKDELWISNGKNVWCERRDNSKQSFDLSLEKDISEMTVVTSKNHNNLTLKNLIDRLKFKKTIEMGSIGCKIASIIRGDSDIYICLSLPGKSSPKDWDFAAPEAILNTAGGRITRINNESLIYGQTGFEQGGLIIASKNNKRHKEICLQIKEIIEKENNFSINF